MTVAVYVYTFLQLSGYAIDLVDTEEKRLKRFINGLNPVYKKIVVACQKPTTFDDAIDRAYTAEEVHEEELNMNTKRSGRLWFKKGGQFKNKKKRSAARNENKPVCETCRNAHKTKSSWRNTGACLICGSIEHRISCCPRVRRDNRDPQQQGQTMFPTPPQQLTWPAPPVRQQQQ